MTFEFAKQRAVLFGGLSLFAPLTTPINDGLLRDTWSHVDDDAVYVSSAGGDSNPGTVLSPKRTINAAMASAAGTGRNVRVAKSAEAGLVERVELAVVEAREAVARVDRASRFSAAAPRV